jgi:hypothetical protein
MIEMNELVKRLTEKQPITAGGGPEKNPAGFKAAIDRGFVHIRFVNTKGGTELGVRLDKQHCDFTRADLGALTGVVTVGGELTLNYENVRCHAVVDLATLEGEGYLEYLGPAEEWRKKQMAAS